MGVLEGSLPSPEQRMEHAHTAPNRTAPSSSPSASPSPQHAAQVPPASQARQPCKEHRAGQGHGAGRSKGSYSAAVIRPCPCLLIHLSAPPVFFCLRRGHQYSCGGGRGRAVGEGGSGPALTCMPAVTLSQRSLGWG